MKMLLKKLYKAIYLYYDGDGYSIVAESFKLS